MLKLLTVLIPSQHKSWLQGKYITGLAWLLVILVSIVPRVVDLDVFYARDELAIWPWADEFALAVWEGDLAGTLTDSDYPGIPMFWAQTLFLTVKYSFPSFFQQTMIPLDRLFDEDNLELLAERRLVAGLLVGLQIIAAVWLVRRLFGWPAAALSAIFLGLDPFSLTEARVFRLEMTSAGFVCLSILTYFLYLRRRKLRWLLLSGVMAGLGVSSKTSAGLMVPYIWLLLGLDFFLTGHSGELPYISSLKQMIRNGLLWAVGAVGAFWLVWPAMWVRPWEAVQHIFLLGFSQAAERSVWGDKVFFWGELLPGDPGPLFYPVVLAFRTTPLTWIGSGAALLFLILAFAPLLTPRPKEGRIPGSPFNPLPAFPYQGEGLTSPPAATAGRTEGGLFSPLAGGTEGGRPIAGILLLLLYIIVVLVELTLVISKVDRFLLIIFPALNILSALGWVLLLNWLSGRISATGRIRSWFIAGGMAGILAVQLALVLPVHPYYFTYWNPWVGGGRAAMKVLPLGTGEGIDLAMDYLNKQPHAAETSVVCGASQPWCELKFVGETFRSATYVSGQWATADYASFYISHLQRQNYPTEIVDFFMSHKPLYQVDLQGATYVWVYSVPEMAHFAGTWNDLVGLGRLLGYDLSPEMPGGTGGKAGETIEATVWWTNTGAGVDNLVLRWVDEMNYEWGRARIVPQPAYASIPAEKRAIVVGTATLAIPPGTPPGVYFLRIGVLEPGGEAILGEFELPDEANQLAVIPGEIFTDPELISIDNPVDRPLSPEIALLGYTRPEQVLTAVEPAWLTLYWQATASPANYEVRLRLLDQAGQEAARWQGQPAYGRYPTSSWQAGEIVRDVWALQVEPETPVGLYNLEISLIPDSITPSSPADGIEEGLTSPPAGGTEGGLTSPLPGGIEGGQVIIPNIEVWPQPVSYDPPDDMQVELQANFGDRLILLGYDLFFDLGGSEQGVFSPVFYWQSQIDFQESFDILLTLREAASGRIVKEWQVPLGNEQAKSFWKAGEVVDTIYQFGELAPLLTGAIEKSQDYHLDMALHNRTNDQLAPVQFKDGREATFVRIENIQDKIVVRVEDGS